MTNTLEPDRAAPAAWRLARRATEARGALPAAALEAARSVFLDWCAVAIGGASSAPAQLLAGAFGGSGGKSRLVGRAGSAEPASAALVNGTAAHALELDDMYAPGLYHPGAPTIAAALAVADREGASGAQLLRAIAVGYEVGGRVARTLGPQHYRYWHTTGTAGSVGAAAAVAELLELDAPRLAHALALAATMAAGLQQTFRSDAMAKSLHAGHAAQSGVVAGLSAAAGMTGALDVLDGDIGLGAATAGAPSWQLADAPFGGDFVVQQTSVKAYPCCGHAFAAIDAALELRAGGVHSSEVVAIEVATYAAALEVAGAAEPATSFEARFSIPFAVACALRDGRVGRESFADDRLGDPELTRLRRAVSLEASDELSAAFPERRGARVIAALRSGRRRAAEVADRRGSPANPLTPAQRDAKFCDLVEPALGAAEARELRRQIGALHALEDVRLLRLRAPG